MPLDWKNQYCQGDLQIQYNPSQITNDILHTTRIKYFKIFMETEEVPNSQSNIEKEK